MLWLRKHVETQSSVNPAGRRPVINQSLVGVIQAERKHSHIDKLLGARHGVRGIVADDYYRAQ
jgi:hypothetical protein